MAVVVAMGVSCRGEKPTAEQAFIPVPLVPPRVSRPVRPLPGEAFHVEWVGHDVPPAMKAGGNTTVTVTFKNLGMVPWPDPDSTSHEPPQAGAVRLAYRWWLASNAKPLAWGRRADLVRLLQPGQAATLRLTVTAPAAPGGYRLQFDLVQEMAGYFQDKGSAQLFIPVQVR